MALTIGDIARATGTGVETVRYYERIGLMPKPPRSMGNYRTYGLAELTRLSFIRRARDLGFPIEQVRALLDLSDDRGRPCAEIDRLAASHLDDVERRIADLTRLGAELRAVIQSCEGGTVDRCRIVEALGAVGRD